MEVFQVKIEVMNSYIPFRVLTAVVFMHPHRTLFKLSKLETFNLDKTILPSNNFANRDHCALKSLILLDRMSCLHFSLVWSLYSRLYISNCPVEKSRRVYAMS